MFASRTPRRRLLVLLGTAALGIALGGGLAGCGDESSDSDGTAADPTVSATDSATDSTSPSATAPADAPTCADTWTEGGTLPSSYHGCVGDDGAYVKADGLGCSSGQRIVKYDDRFYGVPGGTIHMTTVSLLKDHDYRVALRRCRA